MTRPAPLTGYVRPDQCRFCKSRACYYSAVSECGTFDEVACPRHESDLRRLRSERGITSAVLWTDSTAHQRRGGDIPAMFAEWRRRTAELDARREARKVAAAGGER